MMKYGDLLRGRKKVGYINFSANDGMFYMTADGHHFETSSMAEMTAWISYNGLSVK